jgi:hypothetical protein
VKFITSFFGRQRQELLEELGRVFVLTLGMVCEVEHRSKSTKASSDQLEATSPQLKNNKSFQRPAGSDQLQAFTGS